MAISSCMLRCESSCQIVRTEQHAIFRKKTAQPQSYTTHVTPYILTGILGSSTCCKKRTLPTAPSQPDLPHTHTPATHTHTPAQIAIYVFSRHLALPNQRPSPAEFFATPPANNPRPRPLCTWTPPGPHEPAPGAGRSAPLCATRPLGYRPCADCGRTQGPPPPRQYGLSRLYPGRSQPICRGGLCGVGVAAEMVGQNPGSWLA